MWRLFINPRNIIILLETVGGALSAIALIQRELKNIKNNSKK